MINNNFGNSLFSIPDWAVRNLKEFNQLKLEDSFVDHLAAWVSAEISDTDSIEQIADTCLKSAQFSSVFSIELLTKIKEIKGEASKIDFSKIERLIRHQGILTPSEIFGVQNPLPRSLIASNRAIHDPSISIIPADKKELLSPVLDKMVSFLKFGIDIEMTGIEANTLHFLQGKKELDALPISEQNSLDYLTAVKLWEHAMALVNLKKHGDDSFEVSSYSLRTRICEKGGLPTHQVYTKTLDPAEFENWEFLEKQSNWIPERARLHAKIVEVNFIKALDLSRRLNTETPSVWAIRGNTGAGKTYTLTHDDDFSAALDEKGEVSGAINPDTFKGFLKNETPTISHVQIHKEGSALSYQYGQAIMQEALRATMIIDMRLVKYEHVRNEVIKQAEFKHGHAMLMDIDTPLVTSMNRVLVRTLEGEDPIVPLEVIKQGYEDLRSERSRVLKEVQENETIALYKFYITDESGKQRLAAKKENGTFQVVSGMEHALDVATKKPTEDEVDALINQVIDKNYIKAAIERDHICESKIGMIQQWEGLTVKEALARHARAENLSPA